MAEEEEEEENVNPGVHGAIRCDRKVVDKNIWLWSLKKHVSKCEIQLFAKQAFKEAGIHDFKASDGWYRRWMTRWNRKHIINNQNIKTARNTERLKREISNICEPAPEEGSLEPPPEDQCFHKDLATLSSRDSPHPSEDCANNRLKEKVQNEFTLFGAKKKGERYMKHFKYLVASYAVKNSIKDATLRYRVNKETVSDWIRHTNKHLQLSHNINETDESAELEFIHWLSEHSETDKMINTNTLVEKVELLNLKYQTNQLAKKNSWFHLYVKRLLENNSSNKCHIMYPASFKSLIILFAKKFSKKSVSRVFKIDRKRILEWCQLEHEKPKMKNRLLTSFKHVTDKNIDKEIWLWYENQKVKPNRIQVREKALLAYRKAGYSNMKCSEGWYSRWRCRYSIPGARHSKQLLDSHLLVWILHQIDSNVKLSYSLLLQQAKKIQGPLFKASTSWAVRFFKRHSSVIERILNLQAPLPQSLQEPCEHFKFQLSDFIKMNKIKPENIATFDEIPLNFLASGRSEKKESLIQKSGFENCHASLILCYFSNGDLLPFTLILKNSVDCSANPIHVFIQPEGINDNRTMERWVKDVLLPNRKDHMVLICDSYGPHEYVKDLLKPDLESKCNFSLIPAGCGFKLLPSSYGVRQLILGKIEDYWSKWSYESVLSSGNLKYPSNEDILGWVQLIHSTIVSSHKKVLIQSFQETGIL